MKIRTRFPGTIAAALCTLTAGHLANAADAANTLEPVVGRLAQATDRTVTIDGVGTFKFDPGRAQCFDHHKVRLTCATLVAVGYADKVSVTIAGDTVTRIDIIELQQ